MAKEPGREPDRLNKAKFMQQLGKSGVIMLNGVVSKEEYNKDLTGKRGLETYNKMRRSDGTVRAALMVVKLPILACQWGAEAANDSDEAVRAQRIAQVSLFEGTNFDDTLRQILTFLDFGFSVFEQTLKIGLVDGREYVVLDSLGFRKQLSIKKWAIGEGGMPGVTQQRSAGGTEGDAEIPEIKLSIFTNDKEGDNPEGISLLRAAYKHWYMKDALYQIDAIRHEKQGLGVLKVKVPKGAKSEDKETAREIAEEQRANESSYIEEPEDFSFEFMDMQARTTTDIIPSIEHHDRQILLSVLAQFLTIGGGKSSGSFAASDNQTELFIMAEEATAKVAAAVLNDTVVRNLMELNGIAQENYPKITFGRISQDSIQVFSEALNKLFTSGVVTPDPDLEAHVRKVLHLPAMDQELIDNYDDVRSVRRNPSANPTLPAPVAGNTNAADYLTKKEANALIKRAREMRNQLVKAASNGKPTTSQRRAT